MAGCSNPSKIRKVVVTKLSTNFREATKIVEETFPTPGPNEIVVKNRYVGVNASDINYSAGRFDGFTEPPLYGGFEALGEVVCAGSDTKLKVGQTVLYGKIGAYRDYMVVGEDIVTPCSSCDPAYLAIMVAGIVSSIALEKEADLAPGKTVLVTAAAGGVGHFAVQVAKLAGCHVVGTCSSDEKVDYLKSIGCDRAINYKKEKLDEVLAKEYPKGLDVVYESVGNEIFDTALTNLAIFGRLIIIGMTANYDDQGIDNIRFLDMKEKRTVSIPMTIFNKSASVRGFFQPHYDADIPNHIETLTKLYDEGKLTVSTDVGLKAASGPFVGLEKIPDAVEYLYSQRSIGKVVVKLD